MWCVCPKGAFPTNDAVLRLAGSLGAIFGLLASVLAFLISRQEYLHHFHDRKRVLRISLTPAISRMLGERSRRP